MKKNFLKKIYWVFFILFLVFTSRLSASAADINQKILDLRKQIEELTKQSEQYRGNIAQKQKEADTLKRQIDILNNQILKLQTQIDISNRQIKSTKIEISDLENQILTTQTDINKQKSAIGELIFALYQRDKTSLLAILIKSQSLSEFTDQGQQDKNLNTKLSDSLSDLKNKKDKLQSEKESVENKKAQLQSLNAKQKNQQISLGGSKQNKNQLLNETRGQEKEYQKLLSEAERIKAQFFEELKDLENQALKSGAFIVHVTANSIPPKGTKIFQYPYEDYYLTQSYGNTAYAKRGAYGGAPHNGIDIVSGWGSPIHAIASGTILASGANNGWGNWLAIRHTNDLVSLYSHMNAPAGLSNGTPVTAGSVIGYEGATGNVTGSHLHLSVYRDFFTFINEKNGQLYFNYFDGTLNPLDYL